MRVALFQQLLFSTCVLFPPLPSLPLYTCLRFCLPAVVDVVQVARWRFLIFSGTFEIGTRVFQNKRERTVKFGLMPGRKCAGAMPGSGGDAREGGGTPPLAPSRNARACTKTSTNGRQRSCSASCRAESAQGRGWGRAERGEAHASSLRESEFHGVTYIFFLSCCLLLGVPRLGFMRVFSGAWTIEGELV